MHPLTRSISLTEILIAGLMLGFFGTVIVPALRNSSEAAQLMRCRSNLHEIGQAAYMYAADHDGWIPGNVPSGGFVPASEWGSYVADRSFGLLLARRYGGPGQADYIGSPHRLFCPSSRPELFEMPGYRHPDEINESSPIIRMGYMWTYYPPIYPRSNAFVTDDPHRVLAFDFPSLGTAGLSPSFTATPHPPVLNVLHVGGHVNAVSSEEAALHAHRNALYDWMTAQSRGAHTNPFAGENP
jgi:type II secretory pathway pseudopilin PulG